MTMLNEKENELEKEYKKFLTTQVGKEWMEHKKKEVAPGDQVDLGDYMYDFYPEFLC